VHEVRLVIHTKKLRYSTDCVEMQVINAIYDICEYLHEAGLSVEESVLAQSEVVFDVLEGIASNEQFASIIRSIGMIRLLS